MRIPSILPPLTLEESLEVSGIHSIAGTLPEDGILTERPFRMPHHTISAVALTGGGQCHVPGRSAWRIAAFSIWMSFRSFSRRPWRYCDNRWRMALCVFPEIWDSMFFRQILCLWHHEIPVNAGTFRIGAAAIAGSGISGAILAGSAVRFWTGLICTWRRSRCGMRS